MNYIINVSNIMEVYTIRYADDTCAVLSGNDLSDFIKRIWQNLRSTKEMTMTERSGEGIL